MEKWIYNFGDGSADGKASMKNLLGGKGCKFGRNVKPWSSGTSRIYNYDGSL